VETLENRSLTKYKLIIDEYGGWELFQELLRALKTVADQHATHVHPHPRVSRTLSSGSGGAGAGAGAGAVTVSSVAVAWVLQQPAVGAVILGARCSGYGQGFALEDASRAFPSLTVTTLFVSQCCRQGVRHTFILPWLEPRYC
jgi:hypothetical protein